jgi:ADP-ribose pyrophosphatase YjhB (NUDIX family)
MKSNNYKTKQDPRRPPRELWLKMLNSIPMVYTDVIIKVGKGKALLGRRTMAPLKGELSPIGGMVYYSENIKDAAIRKVKEETGLKVKLIGVIDISQGTFTKGQKRHGVDFLWLAEKTGGKLKKDEQHSEFVVIDKIDNNMAKFVKSSLIKSMIFDKKGRKPKIIDVPFFVEA